jgi:protein involved in sex pheromone biosynthesis
MKNKLWITALALPVFLAACDAKKTAKEEMDASADKMAASVKEMTKTATEKSQ